MGEGNRAAWIKSLIRAALHKAGFAVFRLRGHYMQDGLFTLHNDHFRRTPLFQRAYRRALQAGDGAGAGLEWRAHVAIWAATAGLGVPGDFVECGVNAGFTSSAIMEALEWNRTGRRFFLIDTFAGPVLEQLSPEEVALGRRQVLEHAAAAGMYVTDLDRVHRSFAEWPGAIVVPGRVPDVLPSIDCGPIAFLHLDMNCALPECAALRFFWNRLSAGAMVLLDDYAFCGHSAQTAALDATAAELGATVLSLPTGQGLIVKPPRS